MYTIELCTGTYNTIGGVFVCRKGKECEVRGQRPGLSLTMYTRATAS